MTTETTTAAGTVTAELDKIRLAFGPQLFPRVIGERDELGYPLLNHDCPFCGALALIINEWDAVECLTCAWREFEPDSLRAALVACQRNGDDPGEDDQP